VHDLEFRVVHVDFPLAHTARASGSRRRAADRPPEDILDAQRGRGGPGPARTLNGVLELGGHRAEVEKPGVLR
jgi:hypothetical protein